LHKVKALKPFGQVFSTKITKTRVQGVKGSSAGEGAIFSFFGVPAPRMGV
jgi:hypothetical protein